MELILLGLAAFPLALAILLHLALRSNKFSRRHVLIVAIPVGFVLGNTRTSLMQEGFFFPSFWSFVCTSFGLHAMFVGLLTAFGLFIVTDMWTDNAEHFWGTTLLAGLATSLIGARGFVVLGAVPGISKWFVALINWSVPFFTVGALTRIFLRAHIPVNEPGYYRLSAGRMLGALVIVPLLAMLSFCGGMLIRPVF